MKLQLREFKVVDLKFTTSNRSLPFDPEHNGFNLQLANFYPADNHLFGVGLKVSASQEKYEITVEMRFLFQTDIPIDEEFRNGTFPKVNAPAIAFPYVRAFISNVTVNSGFEPLMLPSVNFVKMADDAGK